MLAAIRCHAELKALLASAPLIAVFSLGCAFLIHRYLFKRGYGRLNGEPGLLLDRKVESRLLRQQFGSLAFDDLLLKEENERTNSMGTESESSPPNIDGLAGAACGENQGRMGGSVSVRSTISRVSQQQISSLSTLKLHERPPFLRTMAHHPGLSAFCRWWDVETSLFRIYTITRTDGVEDDSTTPPYNPSSRRGNVPIQLEVKNDIEGSKTINVYWIDYKGKYIPKGEIRSQALWSQRTWIDHPWVFCTAADTTKEEQTILHYIPYRVIPTTPGAKTTDDHGERIGVHRFRILSSAPDSPYSCSVDDPILPYPAEARIKTQHQAAELSMINCDRMGFVDHSILIRYFKNIIDHPSDVTYRQIRTANENFARIWNTPARGILLAAGFVEHGAYVELGTAAPLSIDMVKELSLFIAVMHSWKKRSKDLSSLEQPIGADGYGRAGFRF